tara:strand:- start:285 stop:515 length:231 start_codon:yes stop_codon:yes gene_type:complete
MEETKSERFKRIAEKRVSKAARSIRLVGNLGNRSLYEASDNERKEIITYLEASLRQMKKDLEKKTQKDNEEFKFGK